MTPPTRRDKTPGMTQPQSPGETMRRDARDFAIEVIRDVVWRRLALDERLERLAGDPGYRALSASDRGLARAIATVALRRLGVIRSILAARLKQGLPAKAGPLEPLLIAGIAQILFLEVPDYAAVDTAVARLRSDPRGERYAGLANAVLRGVAREKETILASADPLRDNTPEWLAARWSAAYGEATARAIAAAHVAEPPLDLTVKADASAWAERLGGVMLPTGTVRLAKGGLVAAIEGFGEGHWWVQDFAAALPARLLDPRPGEGILDLCAAPGGKTAQLAAAGAEVVAVDRSKPRLMRLEANLARLGLGAETHVASAESFEAEPFAKILLDAPCSATGTIRRHPDVAWNKTLADVAALADLQRRLLDHAWTLLRPGGFLVYATCSLEPEEGERQIRSFLERTGNARIIPAVPGEVGGMAELIDPSGALRVLPSHLAELGGCDGFYAARLCKSASA
jgi:16S rRNA (cytosine967-C5)-methyltransferase